MLWPKEAGRFIAMRAKDVYISEKGVKSCARIIASAVQEGKLNMSAFKQNEVLPMDRGLSIDQLANWTFLVDAINFSFWTRKGDPKYTVTYNGKTKTGYLGMVCAVNRAIEEGKPMFDPKYYSKLTLDEIKHIFRSDTQSSMPLLEKRVEVMNEIGNILIDQYEGTFVTVLEKAEGSARKLVEIIVSEFPCFKDIHFYEGTEVAILKRAQILAADLALLYSSENVPKFSDVDNLTMFADYRVPQSLVHFGAMSYSSELLKKLHENQPFNSGDREEVEIRGVSIHATELIVEEARNILREEKGDHHINSIKVDFFLWDYRVDNALTLEDIPYHKTRCIYY